MKVKIQIVTNNKLVYDELHERYPVDYEDLTYHDLLVKVRNLVHQGYKLLSHPLSGSIKPNETPFKSVILSAVKEPLDCQSVEIIENSIVTCDKFKVKFPVMPERVRKDFQLLDFTLIRSALSQN